MIEILKVADLVLLCFAFTYLVFALVTDIRKREVHNWLNFSLLAIALAVRGIAALLSSQFSYFLYALIAAAIFFGLANLFYYTKIFGGGDCKLLVALAAVFATKPYFVSFNNYIIFYNEPFLLTFLINSLFAGSVFGVISAIFLFITFKEKKKFFSQFSQIEKNIKLMKIIFFILASLMILTALVLNEWFLIIPAAAIGILPFLYAFTKSVENCCFVKLKTPGELTGGDLLFKPVKIGKIILKDSVDGLSYKNIALLKRAKKSVLIKDGLPFVPAFVVALLASLFCGNLIFLIVDRILSFF